MSKIKGKTAEELLQEALVPEEEQPYRVPENWVWVYLGGVVDFIGGGTPSKSISSYWHGDIPWASVKDVKGRYLEMTQDFISVEGLKNSSANIADINELLLITRMSPGKSAITKVKTAINQDLKIVRPKIEIMPFFLWIYFNVNTALIEHVSTGSTVKGIQITKLNEMKFPLPPINEQKRIVYKVERLLNKINQVKQLIEEAKESFELRRAAILDKAFRGDLTAKWREENGLKFESWSQVNLDEVALAIDPQPSHRTPLISEDGIPYIGIKECNYDTGEIDFLNSRPVSKSVLDEHKERYVLNEGDFIIGKIGTVGKPFLVLSTRNYVLSANVILIQAKRDRVIPKYLFYLFQSPNIENQFNEGKNATTQAAFGIKKARNLRINMCSMEEQKIVVDILDRIFNYENVVGTLEEKTLQIEGLKNAILSKAFRGELGTNHHLEDSSIQLIKQIQN